MTTAYKLNKGYYTGDTIETNGIAPKGYTFTSHGTIPSGQYAKLTFGGVVYTTTPPPADVVSTEPEPYYGTKMTRLSFRNRFTFQERVDIETAAETDAEVRVLQKDQDNATFIDLADQDVIDGMALLVSKGHITQTRSDEILGDPLTASEQFKE